MVPDEEAVQSAIRCPHAMMLGIGVALILEIPKTVRVVVGGISFTSFVIRNHIGTTPLANLQG
jgi:hypothetical protein